MTTSRRAFLAQIGCALAVAGVASRIPKPLPVGDGVPLYSISHPPAMTYVENGVQLIRIGEWDWVIRNGRLVTVARFNPDTDTFTCGRSVRIA